MFCRDAHSSYGRSATKCYLKHTSWVEIAGLPTATKRPMIVYALAPNEISERIADCQVKEKHGPSNFVAASNRVRWL